MRIIVSGASGLLGRAVIAEAAEKGHSVRGLAYSRAKDGLDKLDLNNEKSVEEYIVQRRPDCFIHCAAERRPDVAEADPEATKKLNVQVPRLLANLANKHGFFLIYISTDYVFDGNAPEAGYEPDDAPNPTNLYGVTKLAGEKEVENCRSLILRVPVLYGRAESNAESAINVLINGAKDTSKQTKMDDWATRYPTNVSDVARVLIDLAELDNSNTKLPQRLHFSSQKVYTKYSVACTFAKLLGTNDTKHLVRQPEGPKPEETQRPRDCHLSVRELEKLGVNVDTVNFEDWWRNYLTDGSAQN